jgi:23S rRNA (uridine2552-2'-O)-methyltransferase
VKHTKPPASRKDSSELYVVAQGFKGTALPGEGSSGRGADQTDFVQEENS